MAPDGTTNTIYIGTLSELFGISNPNAVKSLFVTEQYSATIVTGAIRGSSGTICAINSNGNKFNTGDLYFRVTICINNN